MAPSSLDPSLRDEFVAVAVDQSCELLEIELRGGVLRFVLDCTDGITVEQCEVFSRQASVLLDVGGFTDRSYVLEVTSPGLDRKLYGPKDYRRFLGSSTRITFRTADGRRRTIVGGLERFEEEKTPTITVRERDTGEALTLPLDSVEKARLEIDL